MSAQIRIEPTAGADCRAYLDAGDSNGAPKVFESLTGTGALPADGQPYNEVVACDEPHFMYYDGGDFTDPNYHGITSRYGQLMNVYFWARDIYEFLNDPDTLYGEWAAPAPVWVAVDTGSPCRSGSGTPTACISDGSPMRMVVPRNLANELSVVAHEFGHVAHYMRGSYPLNVWDDHVFFSQVYRAAALHEGFADQNVGRYAMFRFRHRDARPHDSIPAYSDYYSLSLDPSPWLVADTQYRYSTGLQHGELVPEPEIDESARWDALVYNLNSTVCHVLPDQQVPPYGFDAAMCGSVLPIVYWELVWNECRTPYGRFPGDYGCGWRGHEDARIVRSPAFSDDPESLASTAYTVGIDMTYLPEVDTPDADPIRDFFEAVDASYALVYLLLGYSGQSGVDPSDIARVQSVLGHHCVGHDHHCDEYYKLPGSRLPFVFTRKASFADLQGASDQQHFMAATSMRTSGSPVLLSHGTADSASFIALDSPGDALVTELEFPGSGYFEFWVAGGPLGGLCGASLDLRIDSQRPRTIRLEPPGCASNFVWAEPTAPIWVEQGTHTLGLGMSGAPVGLDALVVEWKPFDQPCPPPPSCIGQCGTIEGVCGGFVDCGPCQWADPVGDVVFDGAGDLLGGVAAFASGMVDLRVRLGGNPYPAVLRRDLEWCLDTDLNATTGMACSSGLSGGDVAVKLSILPGAQGTADIKLEVKKAGSTVSLNPCDYDTFNADTNTVRLVFPFNVLGEIDGRFRYVVTCSTESPVIIATDYAPDAPDFALSGGTFASLSGTLPDLPGSTCR